jgi:hypothetical protein
MKLPGVKRLASARTRPCIRTDISTSARTRPCVHADIGASARMRQCVCADEVISLPSPSLCTPSLALRGWAVTSAWTREKNLKNKKIIFIYFWLLAAGKERKKMFGFQSPRFPRSQDPQDPQDPRVPRVPRAPRVPRVP